MKGRPSLFANEELITKAQQVFWEKGYTATSLDDLLKAMSIGSGSFYHAFKGGKKELFTLALQQRRAAFRQFNNALLISDTPIDLIKDFFRSLASADLQTHLRGCLVADAIAEMVFVDEELEKEAIAILKDVEQMYCEAIKKEQQAGTLQNQTSPKLLARYLIAVYNGINVTRRMYPNQTELSALLEMQLKVIS